jgi:hypothetical protein
MLPNNGESQEVSSDTSLASQIVGADSVSIRVLVRNGIVFKPGLCEVESSLLLVQMKRKTFLIATHTMFLISTKICTLLSFASKKAEISRSREKSGRSRD